MRQVRRSWRALAGAVSLGLAFHAAALTAQAPAGQWHAPAAELARQIAAITGPGAISLSVKNVSFVPAEDVPRIEAALATELAGADVQVRTGVDISNSVRVTLSQSAREGLWVAEVQQGPEQHVTMVTVLLPESTARVQDTEIVLHRKLLLSRPEPVLDAQWAGGGQPSPTGTLIVLGPEDVSFYASGSSTDPTQGPLLKTGGFAVQHERPFPRDVRGRLEENESGWKAHLPGVMCTSPSPHVAQAAVAATCSESDDPWPLQGRQALFHAGRDFFTGVTVPQLSSDPAPFYSEADLSDRRGGLSVVSLVSGGFRVLDGAAAHPLNGARDWGSDIAALQSGCGSGVQVLASAAGDARQDALVAYEIDRAEAIPASAPLALEGRVTAMWPAGDRSGPAVTVIVENPEPRIYEVYRVTATCGS